MDVIIVVGLASYLGLCFVVGWVSEKRGRGSALGFWLSLFFSPVVGLLVLLALGGGTPDANADSPATLEWEKVRGSLDIRDYDDFAQAFPGTKEAYTALKQKRLVEEWHSLDQCDGKKIAEFSKTVSFPELSAEIRKIVEANASSSASVATYLERLRDEEQAVRNSRMLEEQQAFEIAERQREQRALKVARFRKQSKQMIYITIGLAAVVPISLLVYEWNDQNTTRRMLEEAGIDPNTNIDANSRCAKQEASLLLAEVREREENSKVRDRIQVLDSALTELESPTSSAQKEDLQTELTELRTQLIASKHYRDLSVARDRFYACESSAVRR